MAELINIEKNINCELCLLENHSIDYDVQRSEFENWIPFALRVTLPERFCVIGEDVNAMLTVYEIHNLLQGIEHIINCLGKGENVCYEFCSSENYFQIEFEFIPEDEVVMIELWINVGNQTKGKCYGYDEGVRFCCNVIIVSEFVSRLREEFGMVVNKGN